MIRAWSAAALAALVCVGVAGARSGSAPLLPLPTGWRHTLQLGVADPPGAAGCKPYFP